MSDKTKDNENTEKVMTKYDLKMQRRAEEKNKQDLSLLVWKIIGIVVVVGLVGWIASYPIRTAVALNKTLFTVNGKPIKQVEYDYVYNNVRANYMANYGDILSYFGLNQNTDPSQIMYTENLTFKDYFDELTVDQLKQNIALEEEMTKAGYVYNAEEDFNNFMNTTQFMAESRGTTLDEYLKDNYGQYATKNRIKPIVIKAFETSNYYAKVTEDKAPDDAAIESYYKENTDNYDSIDYHVLTVEASLPTAPTELADEGAEVASDGSYTPSEAEKNAAMEKAKEEAKKAESTVATKGEAHVGELGSDINSTIRSWLFEEGRKSGDVTSIESTYENCYYVVGFDSRYLVNDVNETTGTVAWKDKATASLQNIYMQDYIEEITAGVTVEDPKGYLNYLIVEANEAANAESEQVEAEQQTDAAQ